jgi:preprotein translocase subunit SecF
MEIIRPGINLNFIGRMKAFALVSAGLVALSLLLIVGRMLTGHGAFNYGIDFAGGTLLQLRFQGEASVERVRTTLDRLNLGESEIQRFGSERDFIVRVPGSAENLEGLRSRVMEAFQQDYGVQGVELLRAEQVGPKIGKDLRWKAFLAVVWSALGILVYIWWRFGFRLEYALGVVIADLHDVLIALGIFAITGKEMTLTVLAAILTIAGYSINDSIVILDRIRENLRGHSREPFDQIVNRSLNETLSRTILTGGTVVLTLVALLLFGGEVLHDFALALLVGVIAGTYSSVFVVAPIVIHWPWRGSRRPVQRPQAPKTSPARTRGTSRG